MAETRKTRFRKQAVTARQAENWLAGGPVEVPTAPALPAGLGELPVGSVYLATASDDPSTLLGYGTWAALTDVATGIFTWERTA